MKMNLLFFSSIGRTISANATLSHYGLNAMDSPPM